jgi:chitinase
VVQDKLGSMGPYAYLRDQWVSFDDQKMIKYKTNYVKQMGLAGAMIWALDLDDFRNLCNCEAHPLLKTINRGLCRLDTPSPDCSFPSETRGKDSIYAKLVVMKTYSESQTKVLMSTIL